MKSTDSVFCLNPEFKPAKRSLHELESADGSDFLQYLIQGHRRDLNIMTEIENIIGSFKHTESNGGAGKKLIRRPAPA